VTSKYLIVNADDFGYSYSINKGIIEAYTKGIVTSTSVMVDAIAASEARDLTKYSDLTIGLHLVLVDLNDIESELQRQIDKFVSMVGRMPDHIDTHKRHTTDEGIKAVLEKYAKSKNDTCS
jgi:chitin disaccharide deacetylase